MKLKIKIKQTKDGFRYGEIEYEGIKETLPKQVITTTDLNRLDKLKSNLSLNSKLLEVLSFTNLNKLLNNKDLRSKLIKDKKEEFSKLSKINISFFLPEISRNHNLNLRQVKLLINLQIVLGFKLVRLFITKNGLTNKEIKSLLKKYSKRKDIQIIPSIYTNIGFKKFNDLITIIKQYPIISFIDGGKKSILLKIAEEEFNENLLIFSKVYPHTRNKRVSKPTLYYRLGVADCYSFLTTRGNPNVPTDNILIFDKTALNSKLIEDIGNNILSPLNKSKTILQHSQELSDLKISSYPSSVYRTLSLNEFFDLIYNKSLNQEEILPLLESYPDLIEEYNLIIKKSIK